MKDKILEVNGVRFVQYPDKSVGVVFLDSRHGTYAGFSFEESRTIVEFFHTLEAPRVCPSCGRFKD